jgi:F-type H+-transporting ATPase subunit gamma
VKREHDLRERLRSLEALGAAVSAMKNLSAHHFREARAGLEPARAYREGIDRVAGIIGAALPAGDGPSALLVIGSELGLCGGYNAHLVAAAARRRTELGTGPTLCVGRRATAYLARRDIEVERTYPAPASVQGITDLLLRLAQDMLGDYVIRRLACFEVVSSRFEGVGADRPTTTRLLPIGADPPELSIPTRYASRDRFAGVAVRELLFVTMYSLLLESLASEHGARLAATGSAERWLDERTEQLRRHLAASRREASTQETIEIAAGARARRTMAGRRAGRLSFEPPPRTSLSSLEPGGGA